MVTYVKTYTEYDYQGARMIREEEDDTTQEMRAFVLLELKQETAKLIEKIESAKIPVTDEWTEGVNAGLEWAVRILNKDKSAS
jgi:hypothetical protein